MGPVTGDVVPIHPSHSLRLWDSGVAQEKGWRPQVSNGSVTRGEKRCVEW